MTKGKPPEPLHVLSTSKAFRMAPDLKANLPSSFWKPHERTPINGRLTADLFYFRRSVSAAVEGRDQLEQNLTRFMPQIVTSRFPSLTAAQANTQIEFDRAYRTLLKEPSYYGKNLAFIAGINTDVPG